MIVPPPGGRPLWTHVGPASATCGRILPHIGRLCATSGEVLAEPGQHRPQCRPILGQRSDVSEIWPYSALKLENVVRIQPSLKAKRRAGPMCNASPVAFGNFDQVGVIRRFVGAFSANLERHWSIVVRFRQVSCDMGQSKVGLCHFGPNRFKLGACNAPTECLAIRWRF